MIFKKGTKLYSILNNKCPRCHKGDFFTERDVFRFKRILKIHNTCNQCALKYMLEPSFYYGAMYVSYGLTVALSIVVFIMAFALIHLTMFQSFMAVVTALVVFSIPTMRLSRIIWINMFVAFEKNKVIKN